MKFFKITLNTVAGDNEKIIFIVPPAEETDENGNPVYDEDFLLKNAEYKNYVKATKAAVVSVAYILYEAEDSTKLNYDELLKNEDKFFKIEQNDYLIEVKKAKSKGGGKKSKTALYIIIGIAVIAVAAMLIYGDSINEDSDESAENESNTSDVMIDTSGAISEAPSETSYTEAVTEESETTTAETTVISEETTAPEERFTLTFDKNGGAGSANEAEYTGGTVVDLPFTGVSRIGYTLMGWATAPTEPYTLYNNDTSRYIMPENPATLYAIWTATEYEVVYNYQIGSNAVTSKERCKYGEIIELMDISTVESDAGEFAGWGLLPNATEPVQSLTMPDGGIELYAIYK